MSGQSTALELRSVSIRRARPEDAQVCGKICYEAFRRISVEHGFPPDFPSPAVAVAVLSSLFSEPGFYPLIADLDGRIVGSNCLDERSTIAGIGPVTVDPSAQNRGVGRILMEAVLARAREGSFPGIRLVQAAFHNRSTALYTSLGFAIREPLAVMQGPRPVRRIPGCLVRPAQAEDISACNQLCLRVHGHDRGGELTGAVRQETAVVVERDGRITGYSTVLAFFGHAVAESNLDLEALIGSVELFEGPGILVPVRNTALFSACLASGLRIVQPLNLMTLGLYNEPAGAWLPSILF